MKSTVTLTVNGKTQGKILNANFAHYHLPRFQDVSELDIHLLNRPDLDSAGGGETPILQTLAPKVEKSNAP